MIDPVSKSRALLNANLTPEQRRELSIKDCFTVEAKGEIYEVRADITERLRDHARFCAVIPGLPVYDQMLARKLYLEHDPEGFFKAATTFEAGQRRRDLGLTWHYFRAVLIREFSARGMDPRLIEIRWIPMLNRAALELSAIYAGRHKAQRILDLEQLYVDDLAAVIDAEAQYLAVYISRLVDLERTKGPGITP